MAPGDAPAWKVDSTVGSRSLERQSFLHNQVVSAVVVGNDFCQRMRAASMRTLAGRAK
jgi:hypothetical protein